MAVYRWSRTNACPITPSKALPVPLIVVGLLRRSPLTGVVIVSRLFPDVTPTTTHMLEVLPSSRLSVTVIDMPPGLGLFTCTTASTSCLPPPLTVLAAALGDHLSSCAAMRWATCTALFFQGSWPVFTLF